MDLNLTLSNRQIVPAVTNMFQFENQTTTLNFVLDSYMWENSDLRNYIPYAITSVNGVIDMTELTANYNEGTDKLTLSWTIGDYTLSEKGAVLYQIVFKENKLDGEIGEEDINNAVWYSYKAVIINRSSIDSDNHITAKYPTIMKQWLDKMESMEDELIKVKDSAIDEVEDTKDELIEDLNDLAAKFDTSVVYIPYGETIAVEDRLSNRLYYQYTDEAQTKGRFEDSEGVILNLDPTGYVTHIGQTIFSLLPIDNAGLHLLDGSKIMGNGGYFNFVDYVAKLYNNGASCFCSEQEWQQSVTDYGVCGKFVYNEEENSVRLPKVTGFVEGTIDPNALGELVQAGLPNITGKFESKGINSEFGTINYGEGAFNIKVAGGLDETGNAGTSNIVNTDIAEFDASKSNAIYGNSNTVQPQTIKGYYYMVVATSIIDKVEIDPYIDQLEDKTEECLEAIENASAGFNNKLNNKVDLDGGNYTGSGLEEVIDSNLVHKTGDEEISGTKTFTDILAVKGQNFRLYCQSDSGDELGEIQFYGNSDYPNRIFLDRYKNHIRLFGDDLDQTYGDCILTTKGISKSTNGYVKFGNGIILQWGQANSGTTVTYPIAFSQRPTVFLEGDASSGTSESSTTAAKNASATNFTITGKSGWNHFWFAIGY